MRAELKRHLLVTGGAGFIGSLLVGELLADGYRVTVVDRLAHGADSLAAYRGNLDFRLVTTDITQSEALTQAVDPAWGAPQAVVHLAALVGFPACAAVGREETWRQNVEATQLAYQQAVALGVERFLFASSYSVYGRTEDDQPVTEDSPLHPQSLYAESKIEAEQFLLAQSDCPPVITRFTTLYGVSPRMRFDLIINQFVLDAYTRCKLTIYQADFRRSFVHVSDIVRGLRLALDTPLEQVGGQIINLGNADGNRNKRELVSIIQQHIPELEIEYQALSFEGDMRDISGTFEKARSLLGFAPRVSVEDGVREVLHALENELIPNPHDGRYRNAPELVL